MVGDVGLSFLVLGLNRSSLGSAGREYSDTRLTPRLHLVPVAPLKAVHQNGAPVNVWNTGQKRDEKCGNSHSVERTKG